MIEGLSVNSKANISHSQPSVQNLKSLAQAVSEIF